jgi:hypothetical protein
MSGCHCHIRPTRLLVTRLLYVLHQQFQDSSTNLALEIA